MAEREARGWVVGYKYVKSGSAGAELRYFWAWYGTEAVARAEFAVQRHAPSYPGHSERETFLAQVVEHAVLEEGTDG